MINHTLRHTHNLPTTCTKPPAQVNLFHVGKESSVQPSGLTIIFQADKQGCTRRPKYRNNGIVLPFVLLYHAHNPPTTERIAVTIEKAACRTCILKLLLLPPTPYLRLASCCLRMCLHIISQWLKPMLRHFHVRIEKYHILSIHFLQSHVITIGKTLVFFQQYQSDGRKLPAKHLNRCIR